MKSEDTVTGVIDARWLAIEVAGIIYNQGKAKMCNILESQIPEHEVQRICACRKLVEDILGGISHSVSDFIQEVLGDWETEVEAGGEVSKEEAAEAMKEYEEIERIVK